MKVQFVEPHSGVKDYQDLTVGNVYHVIGIEADDYRIINDKGLPYLYPAYLFDTVDDREPQDWVTDYGDEGERYAYPPELNSVGFFEDYFDGDERTVIAFHRYLTRQGSILSAT